MSLYSEYLKAIAAAKERDSGRWSLLAYPSNEEFSKGLSIARAQENEACACILDAKRAYHAARALVESRRGSAYHRAAATSYEHTAAQLRARVRS